MEDRTLRMVEALKKKAASYPGLMSVDQLVTMCVVDTELMIEGGDRVIRQFEAIEAPPKPEDLPPEPWA